MKGVESRSNEAPVLVYTVIIRGIFVYAVAHVKLIGNPDNCRCIYRRRRFDSQFAIARTNAGKSTIMNQLSKTDVLAEDKLFATLDTTVRKVTVKNLPFLLSDTVGFIRKLPHQLIESFKSTLAEVEEANVLVHVIDISHPSFEEQILIANSTLMEIGASEIPCILVFNKIDRSKDKLNQQQLRKTWMAKLADNGNANIRACLFISALKKAGVNELKEQLYNTVKPLHMKRYPYNNLLY